MGAVCNKPKNSKTNIIKIESRLLPRTTTPRPRSDANKYVGEKFQQEVEAFFPQLKDKQFEWKKYYEEVGEYEATMQQETTIQIKAKITDEERAARRNSQAKKAPAELGIVNQNQKQKLANLLMKGATSQYRWKAWMTQVFRKEDYDPDLFSKLKQQAPPDKVNDDIRKDIARTFPNHDHFKEKGQAELLQVLTALSIQHSEIGYVQGMNQVVGFALIVNNGNEEEAFWLIHLICLSQKFLWWNLYKTDFKYARWLCDLFQRNFSKQLPGLHQHFQEQGVIDQQYIWQWMLTQFLYTFPMEAVLLFWDYMMANNICSFVQISIAILEDLGSQLINFDIGEISDFFRNFIVEKRELDVWKVLERASEISLAFEEVDDEYLRVINGKC